MKDRWELKDSLVTLGSGHVLLHTTLWSLVTSTPVYCRTNFPFLRPLHLLPQFCGFLQMRDRLLFELVIAHLYRLSLLLALFLHSTNNCPICFCRSSTTLSECCNDVANELRASSFSATLFPAPSSENWRRIRSMTAPSSFLLEFVEVVATRKDEFLSLFILPLHLLEKVPRS
jgi:hypothetical protein